MDMDELFSQVDEKRKVSMKILYHSLIYPQVVLIQLFLVLKKGSISKALASCVSLPMLWLSALVMFVVMATRE